jgi:hypothetical protein
MLLYDNRTTDCGDYSCHSRIIRENEEKRNINTAEREQLYSLFCRKQIPIELLGFRTLSIVRILNN